MRRMTYEALIWLLRHCELKAKFKGLAAPDNERQALIKRLENQMAIDHEQGRL